MSELIPIMIFSVAMAYLSHCSSEYYTLENKYGRKDWVFFTLMAVGMILFAGLRTSYNDTGTYLGGYQHISPDVGVFEDINWTKIGGNPGFWVTNRILVKLGAAPQTFLMFYSTVTVGIYLWFVRKYSCNLPLSIFMLFTFAGFVFTLAAIKQCMAIALCLIATDRAINKKYLSFLLFVLLASLYHPYALMYLAVPFLTFRPWSYKTAFMIGAFGLAGVLLQSMLGGILNVTDMLGEGYDASSFQGEGVNPFRLMAVSVPVVLSFLTRDSIAREGDKKQYIILNLTMLNAEIMFVALFGTANYFARLANYFLPFQAITIPWLFTHFDQKSKRFLTGAAVVCYFLFAAYEHTLSLGGGFDAQFSSMSLWEYLEILFQGG